ncbi:MAG: hypothetical protein ACOYUZ_03000 [Patescibacteria group bacterium]
MQLRPLFFCLIISLVIAPQSFANDGWRDASDLIPQTYLDDRIHLPYLSFIKSRGQEWLIGNPNQLFKYSETEIIDLTPKLKQIGFKNIRQIAGDGQSWLIIGDSSIWLQAPDLFFHYDGNYLKDISSTFQHLADDDYVGQISGKQGMWLIPTKYSLYAWHSSLLNPYKINLPDSFKEPRLQEPRIYPIVNGWIIDFVQKNGPKSIASGNDQLDRRFFYYHDDQFQEITSALGNLSHISILQSNGQQLLAMGSSFVDINKSVYRAYLTDGNHFQDISNDFAKIFNPDVPDKFQPYINQGFITNIGRNWIIADSTHNALLYHHPSISKISGQKILLNSGYGTNHAIFVGYKIKDGQNLPALLIY